ncbi:MAG: hypothetical protein ACKVHE_05640 [Planctomycetales bacterium]
MTLSVDQRSFFGRDHYGAGIKGTLLAGPQTYAAAKREQERCGNADEI